MLCFVALFVLAFLSIFSAKYRPLAKRAFDCVIKKATLRPCDTGLDEEIKSKSISGIMKFWPKGAVFVNRHFEAFSLLFTLLLIASIYFTVDGAYNFVLYGNCNGPEGGFCIYSGLQNENFLKAPGTLDGIAIGNSSSNVTVIEFGCYNCPYTRQAEENVHQLIQKYQASVYFVFKPFPLANHAYSTETAIAASCANEAGKYWEYRAAIFESQEEIGQRGDTALVELAENLNVTGFGACYSSKKFEEDVMNTLEEGQGCGIYGTPTFFVNGKAFVGENAVQEAEEEIKRLLKGS